MMMNGMMGWPMAVFGILLLILVVLAIAALVKYLFGSGRK
jgi:type IV secretory pathway VirB2 component (pilin)